MKYIDLHTHSVYSDGTDTPGELVRKAKEAGLCAVALTDHDSFAGLGEFRVSGGKYGVETVDGIEISTQMGEVEAHVLGYCLDFQNPLMDAFLASQEESRREKNAKTLLRLRELGFDITESDFSDSKGTITRGSIAGVMHKKGYIGVRQEAFDKYLGEGRPAFIDRVRIEAGDAVMLILGCGGIPVLAHPYLYAIDDDTLAAEVKRLATLGLRGIEALYPEGHTEGREALCRFLAERYGLLITGGSDYHGDNKTVALGYAFDGGRIPYEILRRIKQTC